VKFHKFLFLIALMALSLHLIACAPTGDSSAAADVPSSGIVENADPVDSLFLPEDELAPLPDVAQEDPANPGEALDDSEATVVRAGTTKDVLLFNGKGISTSDWQTTEKIVNSMGLSYSLINSSEMNAMSLTSLRKYGMIIVPGGYRGTIMSGLTNAAQLNIKKAVRDYGVSYLGICAGAFAAVGTLANTNTVSEYDLAVIYGKHLSVWWPNSQHPTADMVKVTFPNKTTRWLVWWGGPSTPEWKGGVIARYADGKPAISQGWSNKGFVIVSGPHPEAPQGWRVTAGFDPDGLDYDLTKKLINSALRQSPMPAF